VVTTTDKNPLRGPNKNYVMGYIILAIGVVLQLLAFILAIRVYLEPWRVERISKLIEPEAIPMGRMVQALSFFIPLALLLIMGIIGGLIGKYGMVLSRHRSPDGLGDE